MPKDYVNDEIDVIELLKICWQGKWIIGVAVLVAVLLGFAYVSVKEPVFESRLFYEVDTIPPFYKNDEIAKDFDKSFFNKDTFNAWKQSVGETNITFNDISTTNVIDGFTVSKDKSNRLVVLSGPYEENSFILVRTNDLSVLDDLFKYASFINNFLKRNYVLRAQDELKIVEARFNDISSANNAVITELLAIDRYIVSAEKGANPLTLKHSTLPESTSPRALIILSFSMLIGITVGAFIAFFYNATKKRQGESSQV